MANSTLDTSLLDKAIKFAVKAHAGTERRGKGFPYIVHPMEAVAIVSTLTSDQELLAAAALHDTIEDCDVTAEEIRNEFGDRVASLVASETDGKGSWIERKQAAIDRLTSASRDAKIVAMGDKLSNIRAIWRDYKVQGDDIWNLFHETDKKLHEWHYRGLAGSLSELSGTFAYDEFSFLINDIFHNSEENITPEPVDLNDFEAAGGGYTSEAYNSKDGKYIIKLYGDFVKEDSPFNEFRLSREIEKMGFNVPKAVKMVTDGKRTGVMFERIHNKISFAKAISQDSSRIGEFAARFAAMTRSLHATPCNTVAFPSAKAIFLENIATSKILNERQKEIASEYVKSIPDSHYCLHGDLHIGNAITTGKEDFWIDLADFRYGNHVFDLGILYIVCNCNSEEMTEHLYHNTNATMREFWKAFVPAYFGEDSSLEDIDKLLRPMAAVLYIYFINRGANADYFRQFIIDSIPGLKEVSEN